MSIPIPIQIGSPETKNEAQMSGSPGKSAIISPSKAGNWKVFDFSEVDVNVEDLVNGFSAEDIFSGSDCSGITFDDLIALPGSIDFGVQLLNIVFYIEEYFHVLS